MGFDRFSAKSCRSLGLPIGKCLSVQVVNNQLVGQVKFAEHPFAKEVHELYRGGFLSAVSVGFRSLDHAPNAHGGINFRRQELMEFSAVPVPANSRALLAAAADGVSTKQLRAWAAATLADDGDDVVVELLDDDGDEDVSATFADDVVAAARAVSRLKHPERLVRLDAPEVFDVDDPHALAREVAVGVRAALRELISVETRRAIRAASGRLD